MKYITERSKAILAGASALGLAALIGFSGRAAAAVDDREYVGTEPPGDVWEWDLTSTKWDHEHDCWIRRPQDVPDARTQAPEADRPILD